MDDNVWTIDKEREALIDALQDEMPDTEKYRQLTTQLEALTRIRKLEVETETSREKMEREANLAESKAKAELRLREEESETKKKDSRRGIGKVVIAGVFGLVQIILINHYEEVKPFVGKAFNFVTKPKL